MSWTEIFPVLSDEQVEEYLETRSSDDVRRYEDWFGIERVIMAERSARMEQLASGGASNGSNIDLKIGNQGVQKVTSAAKKHVVSATLFWKHVSSDDPDLPAPTLELLTDARRLGLVRRFSPWESYIAPLVARSGEAVRKHPDVRFRIYLASDLEFLIPMLIELGWDVFLMKSPSIRYCPGGFWRFLALEEPDTLVTVIDTDRMSQVTNEIGRTEAMDSLGLGLWRVPGYYNAEPKTHVRYRPILGGHFGGRGAVPVRLLIEAFLWHSERETLRKTARIPGVGELPIQFIKWPDYGFDEWFQLVALYPRLVTGGTLTFIPRDSRSLLLPVDLEYAQWANPRSESIYF